MATTPNAYPNILLIIADDLGADLVVLTDRSPETTLYVNTESDEGSRILGLLSYLSILARNGLYFEQAWAHPACSPTRGSVLTRTYPWRNGVGYPANPQLDPLNVTSLPVLLGPLGYQCGLFGKWHLGDTAGYQPPDHGWNRHIGTLDGVIDSVNNPCGIVNPNYENWCMEDSNNYASPTPMVGPDFYATRVTVEEAGSWIASIAVDIPWFATIAFHSPHDPFHTPPSGYHLPGGGMPVGDDEMFNAMAQNLDQNIGRLLGSGVGPPMDSIPADQLENTVIIFIGDNGSPRLVAEEEPKTEIGEGGVRVPMIVADGTSVSAAMGGSAAAPAFLAEEKLDRRTSKLVHVVDLYETIAEIAGVSDADLPDGMDSRSLWRFPSRAGNRPPTRDFVFSQYYRQGDRGCTIRNEKYKLNVIVTGQPAAPAVTWAYYKYLDGGIPGLEDATATANNIWTTAIADVQSGTSNDAADNLNDLLAELIDTGNYELTDNGLFPWINIDPR